MWSRIKKLGSELWASEWVTLRARNPATKVDSALFPEDEFPVPCLKCGYLLRGLPDGKCPECGTEFERGRLLVEFYVARRGILAKSRRSWTICWLCCLCVLWMIVLSFLGMESTTGYWGLPRVHAWNFPSRLLFISGIVPVCVCYGWILILLVRKWRRIRSRRNRIISVLANQIQKHE